MCLILIRQRQCAAFNLFFNYTQIIHRLLSPYSRACILNEGLPNVTSTGKLCLGGFKQPKVHVRHRAGGEAVCSDNVVLKFDRAP